LGEGIRIIIDMPTNVNMNEVIKKVKTYMKDKINTNIVFGWTKKDLDSKLSEMRKYIVQKPLNAEIKTYINEGAINAQIQGLKRKLNEANINVKANIVSGTKSGATSGTDIVNDYVSDIEGSLLKQSEVLKNGNLVKTVKDYNLALGETARVVENVSKNGKSFTETLTTSNETVKKTTQSLKLFQEQAKIDVVKFKDRYTGLFDEKQLTNWTNKVQKLTPITENLSYKMQLLNKEFGMMKAESASRGLDLVNKSSMTLGETLKIAFERFPVWIKLTIVPYISNNISKS
jgi:hypothetical protein